MGNTEKEYKHMTFNTAVEERCANLKIVVRSTDEIANGL